MLYNYEIMVLNTFHNPVLDANWFILSEPVLPSEKDETGMEVAYNESYLRLPVSVIKTLPKRLNVHGIHLHTTRLADTPLYNTDNPFFFDSEELRQQAVATPQDEYFGNFVASELIPESKYGEWFNEGMPTSILKWKVGDHIVSRTLQADYSRQKHGDQIVNAESFLFAMTPKEAAPGKDLYARIKPFLGIIVLKDLSTAAAYNGMVSEVSRKSGAGIIAAIDPLTAKKTGYKVGDVCITEQYNARGRIMDSLPVVEVEGQKIRCVDTVDLLMVLSVPKGGYDALPEATKRFVESIGNNM